MKKRIRLEQLRVESFITEILDRNSVRSGLGMGSELDTTTTSSRQSEVVLCEDHLVKTITNCDQKRP